MGQKDRQQSRAIARLDRRPASGSAAEVTADPITVGPSHTINIDLSKLPTPTNVYDADFAWIEHGPGTVSLFFGKRNRDENGKLRSRLEVRFPPEHLVRQFWKNSREFHERLRKYVGTWPVDKVRASVNPATMPAARDHSEWANFDAIAHAGTEACIDLYQMPPSGVARFAQGQGSSGLRFDPVVRVQLTIFELLRLLDSAAGAVDEINAYLPKLEHEAEVEREKIEERA